MSRKAAPATPALGAAENGDGGSGLDVGSRLSAAD
jgi:hypothetical protein